MIAATVDFMMQIAGAIPGLPRGVRELPDDLKPLAIGAICTAALLVVLKAKFSRFPLKLCVSALIMAGAFLARSLTGSSGILISAGGLVVLLYIVDFFIELMPSNDQSEDPGILE